MTTRVKVVLPDVADVYIRSGAIRTIITNSKVSKKYETKPLIVEDLWTEAQLLDSSLVLISSHQELKKISAALSRGCRAIPYLHMEDINPGADLIATISKLSSVAERYTYHDATTGYRRSSQSSGYEVSVIIPVYNVESHVEKCTRSLLAQRFSGRFELIFVDDGSKDASVEKVRSLISGCDFARVVSKINGGAADARNFGFDLARGEFVAFVDGDDYVADVYLDTLYRTAILNDADISQGGFAYVDAATSRISPHVEWFETQVETGVVSRPAYRMMMQTPGIWRRLYSRRFLLKHGIRFNPDFRRHDDLPFNIEVLVSTDKIAISREIVYFYILGRDGQDVGATDERLFIHFRLFDYVIGSLGATFLQDRSIHRVFVRTMISHHIWALERIEKRLKGIYFYGLVRQVMTSTGPSSGYRRVKQLISMLSGRMRRKLILALGLMYLRNPNLPSDVQQDMIAKH